jgi:hypothetical protein
MSVIKNTISAFRTQLVNYATLSYASDSGYEDADVEALVVSNKFPFFNITCDGVEIGQTDKMQLKEFERNTVSLVIQFATRAMKKTIAKQGDSGHTGIYEFAEDIWAAIRSDRTLGSAVNGYLPGSSVIIDVVEVGGEDEKFFIGAAEMRIKFYKDVGRL